MKVWQVTGNRRYLRDFTAAGGCWTAVLSWHSEQEDGMTAPGGGWLLRLGPGTPHNLDVPMVSWAIRFLSADLDRSTPTPDYLAGDAETMEAQHALHTAERYIEAEFAGRFEQLGL